MTKEEAIKVMNTIIAGVKHNIQLPMTVNDIEDACCMAIEALKEHKQGEWMDKDYGIGKCWATCSECGESTSGEAQDYGFGYDYSFPNYCPQCGADMGIKGGEAE